MSMDSWGPLSLITQVFLHVCFYSILFLTSTMLDTTADPVMEAFDYSQEHLLVVQDWFHEISVDLLASFENFAKKPKFDY
jgi:hypothetical protein